MPDGYEQHEETESAMEGGVWKFIAIFLAGTLLSLGVSYFSVSRNSISRDEAITIMQNYSPYNEDKGLIKQEIADLQAQNAIIRTQMQQLQIEVAELRAKSRR